MTKPWLDDPKMRDAVLAGSLFGRGAQPDEMTGIILYLCSPLASFATGQTFTIDGSLSTPRDQSSSSLASTRLLYLRGNRDFQHLGLPKT